MYGAAGEGRTKPREAAPNCIKKFAKTALEQAGKDCATMSLRTYIKPALRCISSFFSRYNVFIDSDIRKMSSQGQATNNARPPQRQQNPSTTHNAQTQRSKRPACQGIFTSNRINAAVGFIVLGLAVAGIWAQLRANAIAAQANKITQNQLNIQLWDECLDRPVNYLYYMIYT